MPPLVPTDFSFLGVDMHSHLLPGLDDGVGTLEEATAVIAALAGYGFGTLYTTPHVMADLYPNRPNDIASALTRTRAHLRATGVVVELGASAEYFLDGGFRARAEAGELRCLPGGRILVEWSTVAEQLNVRDELRGLSSAGFVPVIAHPERYGYWGETPERWLEFVDIGCELQINLTSLAGEYGRGARAIARWLLSRNVVAYAGTDCHSLRQARVLGEVLRSRESMALLAGARLRNRSLLATLPA